MFCDIDAVCLSVIQPVLLHLVNGLGDKPGHNIWSFMSPKVKHTFCKWHTRSCTPGHISRQVSSGCITGKLARALCYHNLPEVLFVITCRPTSGLCDHTHTHKYSAWSHSDLQVPCVITYRPTGALCNHMQTCKCSVWSHEDLQVPCMITCRPTGALCDHMQTCKSLLWSHEDLQVLCVITYRPTNTMCDLLQVLCVITYKYSVWSHSDLQVLTCRPISALCDHIETY